MIKKNNNLKFISVAIFIILLCQINLLANETMPSDYYTISDYYKVNSWEFQLEKIIVENPYGSHNANLNEGSSTEHYGYYAGYVVIDFSEENSYYDFDWGNYYPPHFVLVNGASYNESQSSSSPPFYITSQPNDKYNQNHSSAMSAYIKVTQKDSSGTIENTIWYNYTKVWYSDLFKVLDDYSKGSLTLEYYFTINDISKLNTSKDLTMVIPSFSNNYAQYEIKSNEYEAVREDDPIMVGGTYEMGQLGDYDNPYSLDVSLSKKFSDSDDFFDGDYHDYYKMAIKLYRSLVAVDDKYNVSFQVSSKNDFNLYKDGDDTTDSSKIIPYKLYLKYHTTTNNSYQYELIDNKDIFLLENMDNNNSTSNLYLTTLSTSANPTLNDKGTYEDTIYLNFITDSIYSDNANYTKLIDL
jgi:hypothetical protein